MNPTNVIFEQFYEANGQWRKILCKRNTGDHVDPYLYTPTNAKLRSSNDLLDFLVKNPEFLGSFDANVINLERRIDGKLSPGTTKTIKFLEYVKSGIPAEEALHLIQHKPPKEKTPKVQKIPTKIPAEDKVSPFRRKNYAKSGAKNTPFKVKIGPKSVMENWKAKTKKIQRQLSRAAIDELEKHFCANITKPNALQMKEWATQLNVPFDDVSAWFHNKWRGKLEYEYWKSQRNDDVDSYQRSRDVKSFEPAIMADSNFLEVEEDLEIVAENAEEDY